MGAYWILRERAIRRAGGFPLNSGEKNGKGPTPVLVSHVPGTPREDRFSIPREHSDKRLLLLSFGSFLANSSRGLARNSPTQRLGAERVNDFAPLVVMSL